MKIKKKFISSNFDTKGLKSYYWEYLCLQWLQYAEVLPWMSRMQISDRDS